MCTMPHQQYSAWAFHWPDQEPHWPRREPPAGFQCQSTRSGARARAASADEQDCELRSRLWSARSHVTRCQPRYSPKICLCTDDLLPGPSANATVMAQEVVVDRGLTLSPSPVASTICARQTTFAGVLRSATSRLSRARSLAMDCASHFHAQSFHDLPRLGNLLSRTEHRQRHASMEPQAVRAFDKCPAKRVRYLAMCLVREFIQAGGLISYGGSIRVELRDTSTKY